MSIASASTTVKFHEFPSGTVLHHYQPGTQVDGPIRSISWSKDGNWLALVPYSGLVEIVSIKDQLKLIHTIQGIEEPSCAAFQNSTKKNIAVGTKSGQVLVYDIKSRGVKKRYPRITSAVTHVEFTAKDNHIVAACGSGEAYLYSNVTNTLSSTYKIPRSESISAIRTNPIKKNYVVAGSNEGVVAVWDINTNKNKFFVGSHKAPVTAVAFSPVSVDLVVSTGLDRQFCLYDIGESKCIANIFIENNVTSVDFSPDGKFVVMGCQNGKVLIYDSKNIQRPVHTFVGHNSAIKHLSFRKTEDYDNSFSFTAESIKEEVGDKVENSNNNTFDFIVQEGTQQSLNSNKAEDSFLAEMNIEINHTPTSVIPDTSAKTSESCRRSYASKFTPNNPSRLLHDKFQSVNRSLATSTPNEVLDGIPSPIISSTSRLGQPEPLANNEDLKEFIKTTMDGFAGELRGEIKSHAKYNLSHTKELCMDLLMSMIKEFIKVEKNVNSLRESMSCMSTELPQNQNCLIEENIMLKRRVAALEEEVAMLRRNQANRND